MQRLRALTGPKRPLPQPEEPATLNGAGKVPKLRSFLAPSIRGIRLSERQTCLHVRSYPTPKGDGWQKCNILIELAGESGLIRYDEIQFQPHPDHRRFCAMHQDVKAIWKCLGHVHLEGDRIPFGTIDLCETCVVDGMKRYRDAYPRRALTLKDVR